MESDALSYNTKLPFLMLLWLCDQNGEMGAGHVQAWEQFLAKPKRLKCAALRATAADTIDSFSSNWTQYVKKKKPIGDSELVLELRKFGDHFGSAEQQFLRSDIISCANAISHATLMVSHNHGLSERVYQLEALLSLQDGLEQTKQAGKVTASPIPVNDTGNEALPFWKQGKLDVVCRGVYPMTEDVKTFRFQSTKGHWFSYKPGQFATLDLKIDGKKVRRSYTISSSPSRPMSLDFTVKRVPGGLVSNWLHDTMQPGMELGILGPGGEFTCMGNDATKILLLSAGSGVTPCMSMARYLFDTASDVDIVFLHSARTPSDIIFRSECEQYDAARSDFRYLVTCTRPSPGQAWSGLTGRLTCSMLDVAVPDYKERTVYLCGPEPFMVSTKKLFESAGFPMDNFYEESFGGAPVSKQKPKDDAAKTDATHVAQAAQVAQVTPEKKPEPAVDTFKVHFVSSGVTIDVPSDEFVLDMAEAHGVSIASSCRQGNCGTCKIRKIEGDVECDNDAGLDSASREDGYILACCSTPVSPLKLEA